MPPSQQRAGCCSCCGDEASQQQQQHGCQSREFMGSVHYGGWWAKVRHPTLQCHSSGCPTPSPQVLYTILLLGCSFLVPTAFFDGYGAHINTQPLTACAQLCECLITTWSHHNLVSRSAWQVSVCLWPPAGPRHTGQQASLRAHKGQTSAATARRRTEVHHTVTQFFSKMPPLFLAPVFQARLRSYVMFPLENLNTCAHSAAPRRYFWHRRTSHSSPISPTSAKARLRGVWN